MSVHCCEPEVDAMVGLARFVPVSLAELNQSAALMRRIDRKYLLDRTELDVFLALAPAATRVLTIDGATSFGYRSTYHDTPELASYRLSALGRQRRYKVRGRDYLTTGTSYLEVKTQTGQHSSKLRIETTGHSHRDDLDERERQFVAGVLRGARVGQGQADRLVPVIETSYRRSTLLAPAGDARLTIDTQLAWRLLPDGPLRPGTGEGPELARPGLVVVETKTAGAPTPLDQLLWRLGHRPQRISKYATGLAALAPDLPRTRWNRTLRDHFTPHEQHLNDPDELTHTNRGH